jgi:hypothetical protein
MNTGAVFFFFIVVAAYWAPTIVAWSRDVPNKGSVTVVNALLGWTFIGWVVSLSMACRSKSVAVTVIGQR